ncbi:MAG: hypothetical protein HYU43_01890 [Armatimonadetes bacterium]|nr:hypothetical protein [Planctomycetota bacterium]MBI2200673.1 hypothetical protein [Armatimonadota bacterium]
MSAEPGLWITLDPSGHARVVEQRALELKAGIQEIVWDGVSSQIDPATVQVRSVSQPGSLGLARVELRDDLAGRQALLQRYVGKTVHVIQPDPAGKEWRTLTGTLLSAEGGKVSALLMPNGDIRLEPAGEVALPPLPEPAAISPRLLVGVESKTAGPHVVELAYIAGGLSWSSRYLFTLSPTADRASLSAWVALSNATPVPFPQARWRLLAEETRRQEALQPVEERVTFDCRPAGLNRPVSLGAGESLHLPLASAENVAIETRNVFDPIGAGPAAPTPPQRLRVVGLVVNDAFHGLGFPMPGGKAWLWRDPPHDPPAGEAFGFQTFSEAVLPTTAIGHAFELPLGDVAGLEGERRQTAFRQVGDRVQEQEIEILLRNKTARDARAVAIEHPWGLYEVVQKSHEFEKVSDGSIEFSVSLPAGKKVTVTYRVRIQY